MDSSNLKESSRRFRTAILEEIGPTANWSRTVLPRRDGPQGRELSKRVCSVENFAADVIERLLFAMDNLICGKHRIPAVVNENAIRLRCRFTLSYPDIADLLAERGLDASYDPVQHRILKFGPIHARQVRRERPGPRCAPITPERRAVPLRPGGRRGVAYSAERH